MTSLIKKDRESCIELKKNLDTLNEIIDLINDLVKEIYKSFDETNKNKIKDLIEDWKKEKVEILRKNKNLLQQSILEQNLTNKKFNMLKKIIKNKA